jgi:hypothetical protein
MKKYLILVLLLGGCSMSIEDYKARVKYCESNGLVAQAQRYNTRTSTTDIAMVLCVDKNGNTFESRLSK